MSTHAAASTFGDYLKLFDSLLGAVEETAWSARNLGQVARQAYTRGIQDWQQSRDDLGARSQQFSRFTSTALALTRISAGYRVHRFKRAFVSQSSAREQLDALHRVNARRFYRMSAEHGGAFVKVGQMLSARADVLPEPWVRELSKLQDSLTPIPFSEVKAVIEHELGAPLAELFASFETQPLAAASIGQVHRAVTHDGREVAVKVQRPGIESAVRADLGMLEVFVRTLGRDFAAVDADTLTQSIRSAVLREVDYRSEAESTRRVSEFFVNDSRVHVPAPVDELCSDRVLTTLFVKGEKIDVALNACAERRANGDAFAGYTSSAILGRLLEAYLRQVLELGTFQADPHPGNLLVMDDDRICVLDFGCTERLSPELQKRYVELFCAGISGDRQKVATLLGELGFETRSGRPDTLQHFADALLGELRQMASGNVSWPSSEQLAERARLLLGAYREDPVVRLPPEFVMIGRVFMTLSGLFARYQPQIDFGRHVMPVLGRALMAHGAM
ncbi:MAG TPA: AarF/UbiB family protein [Polyangiaceae bacterium]|nr:AarF/UbiB family protein [Polyangiaceae bacterium]